MDTEILLQEFKDSPEGRALIAKAEGVRLDKRRAAVAAISVAEREYDAERGILDPRIKEAEMMIKGLEEKLTTVRQELNRLSNEKRIAYINRDNLVSTQQDLLRQTVHPSVTAAILECQTRLEKARRSFESGETKSKDIWGIFHFNSASNSRAVNTRLEVIRGVIGELEMMLISVTEDEENAVVKLMQSITTGYLETDTDEWSYNPEQHRLRRYAPRLARG